MVCVTYEGYFRVSSCLPLCLCLQLQLSCRGLLLVAIMGVCVSGWSSPVSLLLIVLHCCALAAPEGRGWLGRGWAAAFLFLFFAAECERLH